VFKLILVFELSSIYNVSYLFDYSRYYQHNLFSHLHQISSNLKNFHFRP